MPQLSSRPSVSGERFSVIEGEKGRIPRHRCPVFVVGCSRSGTTLLYHMLLSSGDFAIYRTESHVFDMIARRFGDLAVRRNREKLMVQWLQSKYFKLSGLNAEAVQAQVLSECRNSGDFLKIVMEGMAQAQKVHRWAENTPEHVLYLDEIKRTLPHALIVHIIRDGRDVALSLDKLGWVRPFPWDKTRGLMVAGLHWEWCVDAGRTIGPTFGPDYMEVHYEDLIKEPRPTLAKIGDFIQHDLEYDHIRRVAIGTIREPESAFIGDSRESAFNPVGRWKRRFSGKQLATFEGLVGSTLQRLGYQLATPVETVRRGLELKAMRGTYRSYFSFKQWTKLHLPMAKHMVDISWMRN